MLPLITPKRLCGNGAAVKKAVFLAFLRPHAFHIDALVVM